VSMNSACPIVVRSIITNMIEPRQMGTVNSLIGVLELLGIMIASPLLYGALRVGFQWGGPWLGLPFVCTAGILSLSTAILWLLPIREVSGSKNNSVNPSGE
jgi:hypothetical protein